MYDAILMDTKDITPVRALDVWRSAILELVQHDVPDLTARQLAVVLIVYTLPGPHRVKDLAEKLTISKPAITRAIDRLEQVEFLRRRPDQEDGRSILISRTVKGSVFLHEMGEVLKHGIDGLEAAEKAAGN